MVLSRRAAAAAESRELRAERPIHFQSTFPCFIPFSDLSALSPKLSAYLPMIRHSVSQWCFPHIPLPEFCRAVKPMGITSIELLEPAEWPVVRHHGLLCALGRGPDT